MRRKSPLFVGLAVTATILLAPLSALSQNVLGPPPQPGPPPSPGALPMPEAPPTSQIQLDEPRRSRVSTIQTQDGNPGGNGARGPFPLNAGSTIGIEVRKQ